MYQKKGAKTAYTIMTIMAIIFLLPLAWIVIASLDANANPGLKTPETWTLCLLPQRTATRSWSAFCSHWGRR